MNVGNAVAVGKFQLGMALEERHHVGRSFQERIDHWRIETLAQFMLQVAARLGALFDDPGALCQRVARHPHPAAGPGRGTAEHRVFFDHDDFFTMPGGSHRSGQSGGAGTDDQYIAFDQRGVDGHEQSPPTSFVIFWNLIPYSMVREIAQPRRATTKWAKIGQ
ncbi:hypothetical protein D3C80_1127160 [compost metagenome]